MAATTRPINIRGNQEWTVRDTGNIGHTRHWQNTGKIQIHNTENQINNMNPIKNQGYE